MVARAALRAAAKNGSALDINCRHLHTHSKDLYTQLVRYPQEVVPIMDLVVTEELERLKLEDAMDGDEDAMGDDSHYQVEYDEFLGMMKKMMQDKSPEDDMKTAFKLFDADGTGKISMANLKQLCEDSGQEIEYEELKDVIDVCSDGKEEILLADFIRVMKSQGICPM